MYGASLVNKNGEAFTDITVEAYIDDVHLRYWFDGHLDESSYRTDLTEVNAIIRRNSDNFEETSSWTNAYSNCKNSLS